jgi:multidrug efflux pump subunit AcrA (membrane-fusion protein)
MKIFKALLVILALVTVVATLVGCSSKSTGTAKEQVATVKRGNLTLDITAAGNLALSRTEDLAIDLFYPTGTKGTIGSVLVEAGDSVKEGQLLVTLDTDEWSNQLTTLANQVTTQERNLLQAQINIKTGEQNLKNAKDAVTTRETSILSAEISLQQAQTSLDSSISSIDYNTVTANLNKAKSWYYYVSNTLKQDATVNQEDWTLALEQAQQRLDIAQAN